MFDMNTIDLDIYFMLIAFLRETIAYSISVANLSLKYYQYIQTLVICLMSIDHLRLATLQNVHCNVNCIFLCELFFMSNWSFCSYDFFVGTGAYLSVSLGFSADCFK